MTTPRDELERNEPLDSDAGAGASPFGLPLLLVVGGGIVGTTLRMLVSAAVPDAGGLPMAILVVNLVGAFALGLLLEVLALRGPDTGTRRRVRLLVGTGVIGGFTTYSALAADTSLLVDADHLLAAAAYALGTVVLGAVTSLAGVFVGRLTRRKRTGT
ncbi:CrcB family protein [Herbiconiux sp. CPCC 203407]|uniref:Fluoride-specific ion channel FluC n=1 Tax=Herbiconiux oxytropis TaxID=2970915 RepID=A0AA41XGI6_9MICO|nr:CrcB family protein [Herbiconiux oxytropis]MCS5722826.1 CrcB family protein [Herbiconiux oxytropis]MCS5727756.1 CrcB family protein [Herbiconiux oxytropis]